MNRKTGLGRLSAFLFVLGGLLSSTAHAALTASITLDSGAPTAIYPSQETRLSITLTNSSVTEVTNTGFSIALPGTWPAGLRISSAASYTCSDSTGPVSTSGTLTATVGTSTLALSGGVLPARANNVDGSCTFIVPVTTGSDSNSSYQITIASGSVTGTESGSSVSNVGTVSQTVNVTPLTPITVQESYSPSTVYQEDEPTLTITVTNPNPVAVNNFSFTDTFNAAGHIVVAATPSATASCNNGGASPSFSPSAGAGSLTLAGSLPAKSGATNGACTFTVKLRAVGVNNTSGVSTTNTISAGTNDLNLAAVRPTVYLTIYSALGISESISATPGYPSYINAGDAQSLTLTLTNRSSKLDLTNVGLSLADHIRKGTSTSSPVARGLSFSNVQTTCGGTAGATGTTLTLAGGSLSRNTSCTVTANYVVYTDAGATASSNFYGVVPVGAVTTAEGSYSPSAVTSHFLYVSSPLSVTQQWQGASSAGATGTMTAGDSRTLTVTLVNAGENAITVSSLTRDPIDGLANAPHPAYGLNVTSGTTTCSGGSVAPTAGGYGFTLTGGTIPARVGAVNGSCTVTLTFTGSNATGSGLSYYSNTIASGSVATADGLHVSNGSSSGTLTVNSPLQASVGYVLTSAPGTSISTLTSGVSGRMRLTLSNASSTNDLTNVSLALDPLLRYNSSTAATGLNVTAINASACTGATASLSGTTGINLSGVSLAAGANCIVDVDFTATPRAGDNSTNYYADILSSGSAGANGVLTGTLGGSTINGRGATDPATRLTVTDSIRVSKSQLPDYYYYNYNAGVAPGGPIRYTVNVDNYDTAAALTNVAVTDTLPNGVTFLVGTINGHDFTPTLSGSGCGGQTTPSTSSVTGATAPVITVPNVNAAPSGSYSRCSLTFWGMLPTNATATIYDSVNNNTIAAGNVCAGAVCNGGSASALSSRVTVPLSANISFQNYSYSSGSYSSSPYGGGSYGYYGYAGAPTRVQITLSNNTHNALTNASVTGSLPVSSNPAGNQMRVAFPANFSTTCGTATGAPQANDTSISVTGLTIPARANTGTNISSGTCYLQFDVAGDAGTYAPSFTASNATGAHANSTTPVTLADAATSNTYTYFAALSGSMTFSPSSLVTGRQTTATITISASSSGAALIEGVALNNTLPTGMTLAPAPNARTTCDGSVSITAAAGASSIQMTGARLARGTSCQLIYDVEVNFPGAVGTSITNTVPAGELSAEGGSIRANAFSASVSRTAAASDNLLVAMSANPSSLTFPGQVSRLTITLTAGTTSLTNVGLTTYFTSDGTSGGTATGVVLAPNPQATTTCTGGTLSATAGNNSMVLGGASLSASASCSLAVNVLSNSVGGKTLTVPAQTVTTQQGVTNSNFASTSIAVGSNIGVLKSFSPRVVAVNERSRLRITFYNPTNLPMSSLAVTDTLPSGLVVPAGASPTSTCAGATVSSPSAGVVRVADGTIPATPNGAESASCYAEIDVVASSQGEYVNTIPVAGVSAVVAGASAANSQPATDTLLVKVPLVARVGMLDSGSSYRTNDTGTLPANWTTGLVSRVPGSGSTLRIRLENGNATALTNVAFRLDLPSGLVLTSSPSVSNSCGGSVEAQASGTFVRLSGATLNASATCEINANIVSNTPGARMTPTLAASAVTTYEGVTNGEPSSATLEVQQKPSVGLQFAPAVIAPAGTSRLTITLNNPNSTAITLSNSYSFTDSLPAGVTIAATPNMQTTCAGTVTANAGASSISYIYYYYNPGFTFAPIPAGGCTISVDVTASASGSYLNYVAPEQLRTSAGNNVAGASATLSVSTLGYISGRVFRDNNVTPNGSFESGTDTGIASVSVSLYAGSGCSGAAQATATTNEVGVYTFNGLAAGTYSVCQGAQPSGTINGITTAGSITAVNGSTGAAGTASNPTSTTSQIIGIVLNADGASSEVSGSSGNDFAEVVPSSIAGIVFSDANNNGVLNGADSGLSGNTINLLASNGVTVVATTTTSSTGAYQFTGLAPGTYYLEQPTQPGGTSGGITTAGTVGNGGSAGTATAANVSPSRIGAIVLPPNTAATGFNFAEVPNTRTIYGWVFLDRNSDGLRNGTDSGLSGQTLNLTGNDVNGNAVSRTTTTASDGSYAFTSLPEGSAYTVTQPTQPDSTTNGTTTAGSTGGTATATGVTPSAITGINLSGANTVSAENNFAEIPVAAPDLTVAMTKSPAEFDVGANAGTYTITPSNSGQDATSGTLTVTFTAPTGMTPTTASGSGWTCGIAGQVATCTSSSVIAVGASGSPVSVAVSVDSNRHGTVMTATAAVSGGNEPGSYASNNSASLAVTILGTGSVSGTLWRDSNRNQAYDAGEPLLQGYSVRLYRSGSLVGTTTTDSSGAYSFSGLIPGDYQLIFFDSAGVRVYGRPVSGGSVANTDDGTMRFTLGAGNTFTGQSLPVPVDPSGIVYNSITRAPVAGAVVTLSGPAGFNPATHVVAGSATYTTGADGFYQFWLTASAPAGTYTLSVTTYPSGYRNAASTVIPACTNTPTVLNTPSPARVHANATAPATSAAIHNPAACPADSSGWNLANTTYYYSFVITPGTSADTLNNHIPIDPLSSLSITKSALTSLAVGSPTNYTVTVSNAPTGSPASGATVLELIPAGVVLESIGGGASGWACTDSGGGALALPSTGAAALTARCVYSTAIATNASATALPVRITPLAAVNATTITLYSSVDSTGGNSPPAPGAACSPAGSCASNSGLVGGNSAWMTMSKTPSARNVELGDSVGYTLVLKHVSGGPQNSVVVKDTLPRGFKYIPNTIRIVVTGSRNETISGDAGAGVTGVGPVLNFRVGNLLAGDQVTLSYRVRVGVGSLQGTGVNRAIATSSTNVSSNEAAATVKVSEGVFTREGCLAGKIYLDCNGNGLQDAESEVGIPGVRLYMEDGSYMVSDAEGKYSLCGLSATTHVLKVDPVTLPKGAVLHPSSNRNAGVADSLFVDMKFGELHRADFIEGSCAKDVVEQVSARRDKAARLLDGVPQWGASGTSPAAAPLPAPGQATVDPLGKENRKAIRIRFNSRQAVDACKKTNSKSTAAKTGQCVEQPAPDAASVKEGAR